MDLELTAWQMLYMCLSPSIVCVLFAHGAFACAQHFSPYDSYRHTTYHKRAHRELASVAADLAHAQKRRTSGLATTRLSWSSPARWSQSLPSLTAPRAQPRAASEREQALRLAPQVCALTAALSLHRPLRRLRRLSAPRRRARHVRLARLLAVLRQDAFRRVLSRTGCSRTDTCGRSAT